MSSHTLFLVKDLDVEKLVEDLRKVMTDPEVKNVVWSRMRSFEGLRSGTPEEVFKELVFCILAANFSASRSLMIVEELGDKLLRLELSDLAKELRRLGHRYPEARAKYIVEARERLQEIVDAVRSIDDELRLREWLVENVKGFGLKEASHFLRNIGFKNLAIIDFHILRILRRYGLIEEFRSLTRRRYLEVERLLRGIAERLGISVAELDLYLWYMDSGRILK